MNHKLTFFIFTSLLLAPLASLHAAELPTAKPQAIVTIDTDAPSAAYSRIYGGVFDPGSPLSDKNGFRTDVVAALKELTVPVVRWPGGCFVSGYHWETGVGKDRKPTDDNQDEWGEGTLNVWQHWNPANNELGIYKGWGDALILPSQRAMWAPDAYTIAAINGMAVDYLRQVAEWCRERGDAKADVFQAAARRLHDEIERRLWDESAGWYINLYPDGSRHRVMSYHVFDLLRQPSMPEAHRRRLAEHIVPGEFLGPYGMYSIALSDEEHWDMEDCDWGGGAQYVGQPLCIAESLYRMEEPERAWDVLSRCLLWVDRFPYFPQTIYTDELALEDHCRGWSLQVSAGAGAQAIIHGVFGLMPQDDGSLVVRPHYNKSLDTATLKGFRFRDHLYDLRMDAKTFQVVRDGVPLAEERHGKSITITEQGDVQQDRSGSGQEPEK